MIERKFISRNLKTYLINDYLAQNLKRVGFSCAKVQRTPLGEKVIIFASRPGLIVGKKGSNIKKLTSALKNKFGLENPQIEISEVENINLDAQIVAEMIATSLEKFGSARFKSIGHKVIEDVMNAGALGIEIIISGKIPGARAKSWRFYQGYLKKCGDMAISGIKKSYSAANLKSGVVGIKVSIMPRELKEKYEIQLRDLKEEVIEEIKSLDNNLDNKIGQVEEIEKKKPKVKKEEKIIKQEKNENSKYKTSEKKPKVKKEEKIIKQEKNDEIQNSEESSELSEVVGEEYEN